MEQTNIAIILLFIIILSSFVYLILKIIIQSIKYKARTKNSVNLPNYEEFEYLLDESSYTFKMNNIVEPSLDNCREEGYFSPQPRVSIYYNVFKAKNANANVIISHGYTEGIFKYREFIYYLLINNYNVFILEHRGHGYSTRHSKDRFKVHIIDYKHYVNDFIYFCQNIVLTKGENLNCYLFAHSMGCAISICAMEKIPNFFSKVILSSPMIGLKSSIPSWTIDPCIFILRIFLGKEAYIPSCIESSQFPTSFENSSSSSRNRFDYINNEIINDEHYHTNRLSLGSLLELSKMARYVRKKDVIRSLNKHTLVYVSSNDTRVSLGAIYRFCNRLNDYDLITIGKDSKHDLLYTKNYIYNNYINSVFRYLNSHS